MIKREFSNFLLGFLLLISVGGYAQEMEFGAMAGGTYYLGELNPGKQFLFTKPALGGMIRLNLDTRWSVRLQFLHGTLAGDDAVSLANEMRNLRFRSSINEIAIIGEFNFLEYFIGSKINFFTPFLFAGPGYFTFNPKAPYHDEYIELRGLGTEGVEDKYKLYGFAAVFGFGFRYSLTNRIGLGVEWGMRKTFTDYLDDISTEYYLDFTSLNEIKKEDYLSDPSSTKHAPGMQRGNPRNNDWYSFAGLTISYRFRLGEKTTCRDFENSNN